MEVLRRAPWGHVVHDHLVEVVDGDDVLGSLLVIGDTGVLEPVTPQDLVGKVRRSNLGNTYDHKQKYRNPWLSVKNVWSTSF